MARITQYTPIAEPRIQIDMTQEEALSLMEYLDLSIKRLPYLGEDLSRPVLVSEARRLSGKIAAEIYRPRSGCVSGSASNAPLSAVQPVA